MEHGQGFGAIQCFFNGLIKETKIWRRDETRREFSFPLANIGETLILPYQHFSLCGPHQFCYPLSLRLSGSEKEISFDFALSLLLAEESIVGDISDDIRELFIERVSQSISNTQFALGKREQDIHDAFNRPLSFIDAEQALLLGHNMHPAPKYRSDFNETDFCYAPESGESFGLHWFAVKPRCLVGEMPNQTSSDVVEAILGDLDIELLDRPVGYEILPAHPWQAKVFLERSDIRQMIIDGDIVCLGQTGDGWRATSSLRAIYHPDCRYMLKFSLSVKLTNSIRHLSVKEVQRGMLLDKILDSDKGEEFQRRYPNAKIIREPGFMALSTADEEAIEASLLAFRDNPFFEMPERQAMVLATLAQAHPYGGDSLASELVRRYGQRHQLSQAKAAEIWFQAYLEQVLEPLLVARCDYGLIFLAHQQNIVVDITADLPVGLFYRDCQGTGFTCAAKDCFPEALGEQTPENFMPHEYVNPYISYYLIFNSSFSLISALASSGLIEEQSLLTQMQRYLVNLGQRQWRDASFIDYLLENDELIFKGNFFVYLSNINENSIEDPSTIYQKFPNPLSLNDQARPLVKRLKDGSLLSLSGGDKLTVAVSGKQFEIEIYDGESAVELTGLSSIDVQVETSLNRLQLLSVIEHLMFRKGNSAVTLSVSLWQKLCLAPIPAWVNISEGQIYFSVAQFEQHPELWLLKDNEYSPQLLTSTPPEVNSAQAQDGAIAEITHPIRSRHPQGLCFKRYSYSLRAEINFRSVCPKTDLKLFHGWMNQPRIANFWELDKSPEELKDYLVKLQQDPHQYPIIAEIDGEAFGYFELYWAKEDRLGPYYEADDYDRGIHLLIGNENYLGTRFWQVWGRYLAQYCFLENSRTQAVVGEPRVDNIPMIRIWEYFGFKQLKTFHFPHKHAALVYGSRQDFFTQMASRVEGVN